jgi:hypothetical protein
MIINITPVIDVFFNLLTFFVGLDFIWCGYWYLKTSETACFPKLLGYLVFKFFERLNKKSKSKNEVLRTMFSMKAASFYMLVEGLHLIASSIPTLLKQLFK